MKFDFEQIKTFFDIFERPPRRKSYFIMNSNAITQRAPLKFKSVPFKKYLQRKKELMKSMIEELKDHCKKVKLYKRKELKVLRDEIIWDREEA